ncbi:hypothetical protein FRC02_003456 [Tulasnella sp. 418]|nr:hypothetical protein FRC02_003456 [Tulasnella sp. 418]
MGINQLWRDSLLNASRTLRSNVLQGRIWGFGQAGEADISSFPSTVFEEAGETRGDIKSTSQGTISRARSSKVKSIIAGFERSTSSASSDSGFEADSPLSEAGSLPSPFSFEDSDSMVTSASEIEEKEASIHEVPVEDIPKDLPVSQLEETSSVDPPPPSVAAPDVKMQLESDEESTGSLIIHTPPPMYDEEAVVKDAPEDKEQLVQIFTTSSVQNTTSMTYPSQGSLSEATMEKLIANLAPSSISGARAWEEVEDLEPGSTRRRITEPSQYSENNGVSKPSSHVQPIRPQSTLVSLFEPPPLPMSEAQELEVEARERDRRNLALLSELRIRLEEVERRLDEMEAREREFEQIKQAIASATTASLKQRSAAGDQARDGEGQESPNSGELSLTCSKCAAGSGPHNSIQSMELPHEVVKIPKGVQAETDDEDPFSSDPTPAGLPSYVFYVGVGVCAVVFRVMMKKVAGRRF